MVKDMTKGNPSKILFFFVLPMIFGNMFQQLYGIIDSMIVGNFVGSEALAAVGASYPITFVLITVSNGAGIGCGVIISQLFGAKNYSRTKLAISTSIITIFVCSLILMVAGLFLADPILRIMKTPSEIFSDAYSYLMIYFLGVVFLFIYNISNSCFNALGNSKTPLIFLIVSSILNVVLDLYFVISLKMGVKGAAYATLISQALAAVLSFGCLLKSIKEVKSEKTKEFYSFKILKDIGKVAVPSILQQSIVSIGNLFVQALVNSFGAVMVAGYAAATKIDSIIILPMANMSNAVSNFTAQNIGGGTKDRIKKGYKSALLMIAVFCAAIAVLLFFFGNNLIGMFVDSESSRDVIEIGCRYLHVVSLFYFFMGLMVTTNGVLRGIKDMKFFLLSTTANLSFRILFAYAFVSVLGKASIWWAVPAGWLAASTVSVLRYRKKAKEV